jgi:hypothetical protein
MISTLFAKVGTEWNAQGLGCEGDFFRSGELPFSICKIASKHIPEKLIIIAPCTPASSDSGRLVVS